MRFGPRDAAGLLSALARPGVLGRFQTALGEYFGRKYVFTTNSGTSANEAAVAGLGLETGAEVICPAPAPIFASMPVLAAGCLPVFADADPRTLMPTAGDYAERVGENTRALVVVHLFGQPAPMDEILALARERDLRVIEDCAQAYDVRIGERRVGSYGDVMCSSLQASKHITSDEGGFVATDDPEIYERCVLYSNAGMPAYGYGLEPPKPERFGEFETRGHFAFGHNHRMSIFPAALGLGQLARIERFNRRRRDLVAAVEAELAECDLLELAPRREGMHPNFWQYPVQLRTGSGQHARRVAEQLHARGVTLVTAQREINYLERVFQEMERTRRTPHGMLLPDSVHYPPGLCPKAEEAVQRTLLFYVHHSRRPEALASDARALREVLGA